jgi:hypothetical protein
MELNTSACLDATSPAQQRANRVRDAFTALLRDWGVDPVFGRSLPSRLRALGLLDVGAEAYMPVALVDARRLEAANTRQVRPALLAKGLTDADVDAHLAALAADDLDVTTPPLITAWGRKPG